MASIIGLYFRKSGSLDRGSVLAGIGMAGDRVPSAHVGEEPNLAETDHQQNNLSNALWHHAAMPAPLELASAQCRLIGL